MSKDFPPTDKIYPEGVEPSEPTRGHGRVQPDRSQFENFMNEPPKTPPQGVSNPQSSGVTPLDIPNAGAMQTAGPTLDSLLAQANSVQGFSEELRKKLETPNLRFKRSQQYLLRNKLSEANNHISAAANKLGAEMIAPKNLPPGSSPVERFINFLGQGHAQMLAAKEKIEGMKAGGEHLNPPDLLLVQVKLAQAQQELEYASILLSKVIDVLKQTMNIQL